MTDLLQSVAIIVLGMSIALNGRTLRRLIEHVREIERRRHDRYR